MRWRFCDPFLRVALSLVVVVGYVFFFSSRRRHTRSLCDWSSDVCSSDLPAGRGSGNSRNGTSAKTVLTEDGEIDIAVPRDRAGSFEPLLIAKGQTRFDGFGCGLRRSRAPFKAFQSK